MILYKLHLELHERKALPARVQIILIPLHLNTIPPVTAHFGMQNSSSTAWAVSPVRTQMLLWAQLSLAHSQLGDSPEVPQGFCSVKALQPAPTQSFFPRSETMAD